MGATIQATAVTFSCSEGEACSSTRPGRPPRPASAGLTPVRSHPPVPSSSSSSPSRSPPHAAPSSARPQATSRSRLETPVLRAGLLQMLPRPRGLRCPSPPGGRTANCAVIPLRPPSPHIEARFQEARDPSALLTTRSAQHPRPWRAVLFKNFTECRRKKQVAKEVGRHGSAGPQTGAVGADKGPVAGFG